MMKRISALLLAALTLAAFAACGKPATEVVQTDPIETTPVVTSETATEPPTTEAEPSTALDEDTTVPDTTVEDTTVPVTTLEAATTETTVATTTKPDDGVKTPSGTAEIVKFYNDAANNTKNQKNFTAVKNDKLECHVSEGFLQIVDGALNDLRKDNPNQKETFVNGKGTKNTNDTPQKFLPVEKQSYMSKLKPEWLSSASCKKNADGTFSIELKFKEENFVAKSEDPKQHHSCMDTLDVDWNGLGFEVEDSTMGRIHDAVITATVSKDGKLLKELHINEPVQVKGRIKVAIWLNLTVDGYWKQDIAFSDFK